MMFYEAQTILRLCPSVKYTSVSDAETYVYIELCHFLKLLSISMCRVSVSAFMLHRLWTKINSMLTNYGDRLCWHHNTSNTNSSPLIKFHNHIDHKNRTSIFSIIKFIKTVQVPLYDSIYYLTLLPHKTTTTRYKLLHNQNLSSTNMNPNRNTIASIPVLILKNEILEFWFYIDLN
jgi:hypothetical protein